jgi:hypothetical protein
MTLLSWVSVFLCPTFGCQSAVYWEQEISRYDKALDRAARAMVCEEQTWLGLKFMEEWPEVPDVLVGGVRALPTLLVLLASSDERVRAHCFSVMRRLLFPDSVLNEFQVLPP